MILLLKLNKLGHFSAGKISWSQTNDPVVYTTDVKLEIETLEGIQHKNEYMQFFTNAHNTISPNIK